MNRFVPFALSLLIATAWGTPSLFAQQKGDSPAAGTPAQSAGTAPAAEKISADAPLRVAFVNAADEKGEDVYDTIDEIFGSMPEVVRIDRDITWQTAQGYNLSKKDFRSGKNREDRKDDFNKFMSDLQAEVLFVIDVFGKGRKLQIVTLDHSGKEINDQRRNIRRAKISSSNAKKMISKALKAAKPGVKEFRAAGGWTPPTPEPLPEEELVEAAPKVVQAAPAKEPGSPSGDATKRSPFSIALLGTFGQDSVELKNKPGDKVTFSAGYPGGALAFSSVFLDFSERAHMGVSLFGGFSYFKTSYELSGAPQKATSYYAYGQLQLDFPIEVAQGFFLTPFVGGDLQLLSIKEDSQKTQDYVGNRLIGARAGLGFSYYISGFEIGLGGGVVPSFLTEISKKYYGKPAFTMSYTGRLQMSYHVTDSIFLVAGYDFRYVSTKLKEANRLFQASQQAPSFRDMNHLAWGGIGFSL